MPIKTLIKASEYYDLVSLMLVGRELTALPGVEDAGVMMGTEANKSLLAGAGLLDNAAKAAGPNDLVIAIRASRCAAVENALQAAEGPLEEEIHQP